MQIRSVDRSQPAADMPAAVQPVLQRLSAQLHGWVPDQLTVNDYEPGVGLSPHIDTHSAFTGERSNACAVACAISRRLCNVTDPMLLPWSRLLGAVLAIPSCYFLCTIVVVAIPTQMLMLACVQQC